MTNITISSELLSLYPNTALGVLRYKTNVALTSDTLNTAIMQEISKIQCQYKLEDIAKLKEIANTRTAYKTFGKAPSEYRNSAEAMLRRCVKGLGLYQINNIVDIGNLFSIQTGFSVGSYDLSKTKGDISLEYGKPDTHYEGIGKSSVNIANLPILCDEIGAFGNPCGDSFRTQVTLGDLEILTIIYAFSDEQALITALNSYESLLKTFCSIKLIEKKIIKN